MIDLNTTPLSRRLRKASSIRRGDRILMLAAAEIERLYNLRKPDPNNEDLIRRLRAALATRNAPEMIKAMSSVGRRDIELILSVIDPGVPPVDEGEFMSLDGMALTIDQPVRVVETTEEAMRDKTGIVVGLGGTIDENVVVIRLDGTTRCREFHPGRLATDRR